MFERGESSLRDARVAIAAVSYWVIGSNVSVVVTRPALGCTVGG
jgi:hypothetical protein